MKQLRNFNLKIPFKDSRVELPEILIAILTILNLFFTSLPLVKILGFEHSALNGIILFYFGGLLTIKIFRKSNDTDNKLLPVLSNYGFYFLLICVIPFVIGLISSIFMVHCPLIDGILFYIIISLPSFFFGIAAGYLSYTLSKKFAYLIFSFSYILILLSPLFDFYYNPQIYFYNPIFGFYPGVIFDEDLTVDKLLIAYRLFNIIYFTFMIFVTKRSFNKKTLYKLSMVGLLIQHAQTYI